MDILLPVMLHYKILNNSNRINFGFYKKMKNSLFQKNNIYFVINLMNIIFWNITFPIIIHGIDKFLSFLNWINLYSKEKYNTYFNKNSKTKITILISSIIFGLSFFNINKKNILTALTILICLFHFSFEIYAAFYNFNNFNYQIILFDDDDREYEMGPQDNHEVPDTVPNDNQNVHDSQVNKTLQKTFNDIKKVTKCNISKKDTFSQINNLVEKQTDPVKKKQLKFILNWIQNNNIPISSIGVNIGDVLTLLWNRIHSSDCKEHKETLYENLLFELRDSTNVKISNKCLTGVWARLMDTANQIDPLVNIKPKWALRRELINKANVIYQAMEDKLSEEQYEILTKTQLNQEEISWFNKFKLKYQKKVKKQCYKEYVETNILSYVQLNSELNEWLHTIL